MIVIDLDECGVCEKCIPVCPKDLIEKKGYTMIIKDGCDDCGICMDMCPLGAIYEELARVRALGRAERSSPSSGT